MSKTQENGMFKSKEFALRAQKKILSQFSTRKTAKTFINENLSNILDLLYQLIKSHTQDKQVAEKFVKNIIKISIKIGILAHNDQFSPEEVNTANKFSSKFQNVLKTVTSFIEVDFTYDKKHLVKKVNECEALVESLVRRHLTDKSLNRIHSVASHLKDETLLDSTFKAGTLQNEIMSKMVVELGKAIDNGDL